MLATVPMPNSNRVMLENFREPIYSHNGNVEQQLCNSYVHQGLEEGWWFGAGPALWSGPTSSIDHTLSPQLHNDTEDSFVHNVHTDTALPKTSSKSNATWFVPSPARSPTSGWPTSQWQWGLPQLEDDTSHNSTAEWVDSKGKAKCIDLYRCRDSSCIARPTNASANAVWHVHSCKATLSGSSRKGNAVKFVKGRVKVKTVKGHVDQVGALPSPSLNEGNFKLPDKAWRLSGYPGESHVLLPLYTLQDKLNLHLPHPKGVCLSTKVDYKEFLLSNESDLRPVKKYVKLSGEPNITDNTPKGLNCFFANVTSFSNKVKHFIRLNRLRWHVVGLLETHEVSESESFWNQLSYKANINPAQRIESGTHGGEMLASQDHINASDIRPQIWDIIKGTSLVPLSIAAKILTLHKRQYIVGVTYWNAGQELSKANIAILQQIHMLTSLLNLPVIMFGDFNIDISDLRASGILQAHNLTAIELPGGGTIKNGKRKIDYILTSGTLYTGFVRATQVKSVPFGPHFGYIIKFSGLDIVSGTKVHIPKPLPLEQYHINAQSFS